MVPEMGVVTSRGPF